MTDAEFLERCTALCEKQVVPVAKSFVLSGVLSGVMYSDEDWPEWISACLWREHLRRWLLKRNCQIVYVSGEIVVDEPYDPSPDGDNWIGVRQLGMDRDENAALLAAAEAVVAKEHSND